MIVMWGSNARNAHPIFFHHVLQGRQQRRQAVRRRPAPLGDGAVRRSLARPRTSAPTSRCRTRSPARSSTPGSPTRTSSTRATTRLRRVRGVGRGLDARARRAGHRRAGRDDPRARPRLRHAPSRPSCAGRSASPSTTTASTTCSRSSTWRCSPATSAARAPGSTRCAGRTTCRAAATWARSRTSCPASRTSIDDVAREQVRGRVGRHDPARARAGTSPRCSRRWSAASSGRCS